MRRQSLTLLTLIIVCVPAIASAGSRTFSTPGTYTFDVPLYSTLTVQMWGGGGGGGSSSFYTVGSGSTGATSSFSSVKAGGGSGGHDSNNGNDGSGGAGGIPTGGDTINDASGEHGYDHDRGGNSPNGGKGGVIGKPGNAPGGGGGGGCYYSPNCPTAWYHRGGGGGGGAYATKSYGSGVLTPKSNVKVVVGGGGSGAWGEFFLGWAGAPGRVTITWTDASTPPTVTLTAKPTSVAFGGSSTLTWTVSNATRCTADGDWKGDKSHVDGSHSQTIDNITANRTFTITCIGSGNPASDSATVTVGPTVSLTSNKDTVMSGGSATLTWLVTNATRGCTASGSGDWTGSKSSDDGSHSQTLTNLIATHTYTLNCTGDNNMQASDSVLISVNQMCTSLICPTGYSHHSGSNDCTFDRCPTGGCR